MHWYNWFWFPRVSFVHITGFMTGQTNYKYLGCVEDHHPTSPKDLFRLWDSKKEMTSLARKHWCQIVTVVQPAGWQKPSVPGCHLHAWFLSNYTPSPHKNGSCYPILPNSCCTVEVVVGYLNSAQRLCQELFGRPCFFPEPLQQVIMSNLQVTKCLSKKSNKLYD